MRKGYSVKYKHHIENSKDVYYDILTIKYIITGFLKIPYLIKFGESNEFKRSINRKWSFQKK